MVCRHQADFANRRLGTGGTKAGSFDIRPCLLRAGCPDRVDIETVALGERNRRARRNLRGKTRENGEGGCNERRNRDCGKTFTPARSMQQACSVPCAIALTETQKAQKAARANRDERKSLREAMEKAKKRGTHLKELQAAFNAWVRARDAGKPCISCGRYGQDMQAGHYRSVGSSPGTRFMPNNCWLQCRQCNLYQHGSPISYRINLIKRIGLEAVEELEKEHPPVKLTVAEIVELKAKYRAMVRGMKKAVTQQLEEVE